MRVDGTCNAACEDYQKAENTCKYVACKAGEGLHKDGTCVANARLCNGAGAASNYYVIAADDFKKCKLKDKSECTDNAAEKL